MAVLLALISCLLTAPASSADGAVAAQRSRPHLSSDAFPATTSAIPADRRQVTRLQQQTGLTVTIDQLRPVSLVRSRALHVAGVVTNSGKIVWREAQVYLEIAPTPATDKSSLDAFAAEGQVFGRRLIALNLFDQIGDLPPGASTPYHLKVPYHRLPIAGTPGVYHVGVSVLAGNRMGRDAESDARADTFVPLLPRAAGAGARSRLRPTPVVTLLPLTAPVLRQSNGYFLNDRLLNSLTVGGRLRDALDFAAHAPPNSVQVVLDPALRDAVEVMARGYVLQTLRQRAAGEPGRRGTGQQGAQSWLHELNRVAGRQMVSLMSWAAPDDSALAAAGMPGVAVAGVKASLSYAAHHGYDQAVVAWQPPGLTTRRALSVAHRAGSSVQVVSERSLPRLASMADRYAPPVVRLHTRTGPLTAVVTSTTIAGTAGSASMTALQFRQNLVAEATVRSLGSSRPGSLVFALPTNWNPGVSARLVPTGRAFSLPSVRATPLQVVATQRPTSYTGPVQVPAAVPDYPHAVLGAIPQMRNKGRVATGILSRHEPAANSFNQELASAGSSAWRRDPEIATALIRQQAAAYASQISKVTVTGPAFVALSSTTGRFPITVSNGLKMPITVAVDIKPGNPALDVSSIGALRLAAGQRRDVQVVSRASGSGLTQVWVRLSTTDHRLFGTPWRFNVRATQFGVIIWIAMAAGAAVLFGAAAVRIYRRIRSSRAQASTEPARS